jgi:hypothetical protein
LGKDGDPNSKNGQHQKRQAPDLILLALQPVDFLRWLIWFQMASWHRSFPHSAGKSGSEESRKLYIHRRFMCRNGAIGFDPRVSITEDSYSSVKAVLGLCPSLS